MYFHSLFPPFILPSNQRTTNRCRIIVENRWSAAKPTACWTGHFDLFRTYGASTFATCFNELHIYIIFAVFKLIKKDDGELFWRANSRDRKKWCSSWRRLRDTSLLMLETSIFFRHLRNGQYAVQWYTMQTASTRSWDGCCRSKRKKMKNIILS